MAHQGFLESKSSTNSSASTENWRGEWQRSTRSIGGFNAEWMSRHCQFAHTEWARKAKLCPCNTGKQQTDKGVFQEGGSEPACRAYSPAMHQSVECVLRSAHNASWLAKRMGKILSHGISFTNEALRRGGGKRSTCVGTPKEVAKSRTNGLQCLGAGLESQERVAGSCLKCCIYVEDQPTHAT